MNTQKETNVIPLFPESEDISAATGWDPYIFSLLAGRNQAYIEERRRTPRPLTALRRRALLLSKRRKA